jgi:NAD(P)-dependent dehydrogenase (short-subunit alcohol dehydrogenase family)
MNQIRLDGRVAIVTGAGTGLGRAHALALAERGAAVVVNDVGGTVEGRGTSDVADTVAQEIRVKGGRAVASHETVARRAGGQAMVDQAKDEFGGIDIVVANAGIQRNDPYETFAEQDMHDMLDVHLKGSFWVTQAAYRVMQERRYGRVVFTSSGAGFFGRADSPGYAAAKSGILGLMNTLAIEGAACNVLANTVAPVAYTRMSAYVFGPDLAERLPPEFVSDLVVYLASEQCSITHEVIEAALGRYARVFVGRTAGWHRDPGAPGGPEDIAEHLDEIRDMTHFIVPAAAREDLDDLFDKWGGP